MKNELTVITIHAGEPNELIRTLNSIDSQVKKPKLNLVIIKKLNNLEIKKFKKKYRKFIIGKDKSLWNAMNIGIKKTRKHNILFLNSGDTFYTKLAVKKINSYLKKKQNKILIFKTVLKYKKMFFYPKKKYFNQPNYSPHPSFVYPNIDNEKTKYFDEKNLINADGDWMEYLRKKTLSKKINFISSMYYLGGQSSYPTFYSISNLFNYNFFSGIKEIIKIILFNLMRKENYYKLIYLTKFNLKIEK